MNRRGHSDTPFGTGKSRAVARRDNLQELTAMNTESNQEVGPGPIRNSAQEMETAFGESINTTRGSLSRLNINQRPNLLGEAAGGPATRRESVRSPLESESSMAGGEDSSDEVTSPIGRPKAVYKIPIASIHYEGRDTDASVFANYFPVTVSKGWRLYQFHTTFNPDVVIGQRRKQIIHQFHKDTGEVAYVFDGSSLITTNNMEMEIGGQMSFNVLEEQTKKLVDVTLRLVACPSSDDPIYTQIFNLVIRKSLFLLNLEEIGRNFFNRSASIVIPNHRIQLWPGYITSIRPYEDNILLSVEVTHKVLRQDSILTIIRGYQNSRNYRDDVFKELQHAIVMTHYNKKMYKVEDIEWDSNPNNQFEMRGKPITYIQYFLEVYGEKIQDINQPLLVVKPTKKDKFKGFTNKCLLVPELCQMTGLNDAMRGNMGLMKELGVHLHMGPEQRVKALDKFINELISNEKVMKHLEQWKVTIHPQLVTCPINIMKRESIAFSSGIVEVNAQADWTMAFRSHKMLRVKEMKNWTIVFPSKDKDGVTNFINTIVKVASAMNFKISKPSHSIEIQDVRVPSYLKALTSIQLPVDIVVVILPQKATEPYTTIKRFLSVDLGVPSQGFVAKNLYSKGIMSIATKVVIQMNAKLGGEPWAVKIPIKSTMIVGFDVLKAKQGSYVGAMVSTTSQSMGSYYSHTYEYSDANQLSTGMIKGISESIKCYMGNSNDTPPERVIVYREGVGDDNEVETSERESKVISDCLGELYLKMGLESPKFAYIVVNRRCGTRLFDHQGGKFVNPTPGTIVQSKITLPNMDNFFMVAQAARQGTVAPCCYRVYHDTMKLSADKIQLLTYKFCHLYFNWSGTIGAPAPCQYAKKLAFMAVNVYGVEGTRNKELSNTLHFL